MIYKLANKNPVVRVIVDVVIVGLLIASIYSVYQSYTTRDCFREWAKATTERAEILTNANTRRGDALDKLVRDIPDGQRNLTQFNKDRIAYLKLSDELQQAVKDNPVPPAPELRC